MLLEMLLGANTPTGSQTFTSSGTFVVPNNTGYISVAAVGAGGAGGGASASYGGVGGAGGALVYGNNIPVTPGETLTIEIGAAGAGSTAANGGNGGYTEIRRGSTTLLRANGGAGGVIVNTSYAGLTTSATSANIGGYPYNQAGGNGGGAGYATWGGSGGGGAGGFSGAGGTSGTESFSYPGGTVSAFGYQARMLATDGSTPYIYYCDGPYIRRTTDFSSFTTVASISGTFTYIMKNYSFGTPLIAVGTGGQIQIFNGTTWSAASSGTSENIFSVSNITYGTAYNYAACGNGTVLVNSAASNWSNWSVIGPGTTGTSEILFGSLFVQDTSGTNYMLFPGANGTILRQSYTGPAGPTPPPTTYSLLTSGTTENLWGAAYEFSALSSSNRVAIICGTNGTILRSTGASSFTSWTSQTSGTTSALYRATYYNGNFYCVGANGTIVKSTDGGVTWTVITTGVIPQTLWGIQPPVDPVGTPIYGVLENKNVFPLSGDSDTWYNCYLDFNMTGNNGAGGGGGGGAGSDTIRAGGGGGVGVTGTGSSGTGGTFTAGNAGAGTGGSSGATGTAGTGTTTGGLGGNYGAGGAGAARGGSYAGASGADGAMRLIWGPGRSFPSGT